MKIICKQENLIKGLNKVSHLTGKNFNLPILNNILIKIEKGNIEISATNLEIGVKTQIRGKVESEGRTTVPAKIMTDYINLINGDKNIDLEEVGGDLSVMSDDWQTKIKANPADDYPLIPEVKGGKKYKIKLNDFKQAVNSVLFAASFDEARPELTGVLFNFKGKNLVLAATNSYRLAERMIELESEVKEEKIIVPLRSIQELSRVMLDMENEFLTIDFEETQVKFDFEETVVISRLIEGDYPDYKQVVPASFATEVEIETGDLIKAVKAASLFAKTGIFDVTLEFINGTVIIKAINSQVGENTIKIKTEQKGGNVAVVFNYKFLLDGLNNINSGKTRIFINSASNPIVFRPAGEEKYMYLVMPIKQ
jgi:DNA polymerase III subunit beta